MTFWAMSVSISPASRSTSGSAGGREETRKRFQLETDYAGGRANGKLFYTKLIMWVMVHV